MAPFTTQGCLLHLDLHTIQLTLLPTKFREVVNLSGLVVYKWSNTQGIMIMIIIATESKCEKINELVNSNENMDRDPVMFTSDVSLPKDDKTVMRGKQITDGQLTGLKTHHNANYATNKGRGSKAWAVHQNK